MSMLRVGDCAPSGDSLAYYRDRAEHYAQKAARVSMRRQLDAFAARLEPGALVLDAGCGSGRDLAELAGRGFGAYGVDQSGPLVRIAARAGLVARVGDIRALPFPAATFDGVWACASLVHMTAVDARRALSELRRVSEDGARLYVSVKLRAADEDVWQLDAATSRWFRMWGLDEFAEAVEACGWSVSGMEAGFDGRVPGRQWSEIHADAS